MDSEHHQEPEFTSPEDREIASYGGAIFSRSHHFTVTGGTFTSITNNQTIAPSMPHDFRRIPLGDIDLLREIRLDNTGIADYRRRHERPRVRRIYTAKIEDRKSDVTVAIYQGEGAHEEWREDMERYSWLRHPNLVQLCRFASSSTMHATVFNDDLIPFKHFLELYRHSPILTVYIYGLCNTEFKEVKDYFRPAFQQHLSERQCTIWIRRSTDRLCVDLIPSDSIHFYVVEEVSHAQGFTSLSAPCQEAMVIESLTIEQYHRICYWDLSHRRKHLPSISITLDVSVNLGAVIGCSSSDQLQDWMEIASLPDVEVHWCDWYGEDGEDLEDGWTRLNSWDVSTKTLATNMYWYGSALSWLSQANRIFRCLQITSNFENYLVVEQIYFRIQISAATEDAPHGFLFLCPVKDLQTGPSSFGWPDCPAYWSRDPSGVEHLTTAEATQLGFPSIQLSTKMRGSYWDASVYVGLRQFHQGKGFDPDSQDVARHLGCPLYQTEVDRSFVHIDPDDGQTEASNLHDNIPPMLFLM